MKILFVIILLLLPISTSAVPHIYYASTTGSGTSCTDTINSPCSLKDLLDGTMPVSQGSTVYIRGGTYLGKFTSNITSSAGNIITFKSYPGEWAIIDGYVTTTITAGINDSVTTMSIASAAHIKIGDDLTFQDGSPGSAEQVRISNIVGTTITLTGRGLNGTTPVSHSSGVTVVLGGNQLLLNGTYIRYQDFEITNSDTVRVQTPANSQNAPNGRGEGVFISACHNELVNLSIHDVQDGIFNGSNGCGTIIYGCLIYNNGYVANGVYNGHGIYIIHNDVNNTAFIKENIVWNNSSIGIKGDSQSGDAVNIWSEGNIAFNSGSWAQGTSRTTNLLMSSNNGIADAITVTANYLWMPIGVNGTNFNLNLIGGSLTWTDNFVANGIPINLQNSTPLTVSGNTIRGTNNTGGGNNTMILYQPTGTPTVSWNNNTYFNSITSGLGYYPTGIASSSSFSTWKSTTGFDAASSETLSAPAANWIAIRNQTYNTNRFHLVIYNWLGSDPVSVNVSGKLNNGDTYSVYAVEAGTFPSGSPLANGTVSSNSISIAMNGTTVIPQIGADGSSIKIPASMGSGFKAFIIVRTGAVSVCKWDTSPACN